MKLDNKRLSVHYIGGRGGTSAFPVLRKFEKDIINVLYDADPDCLAEIRKVYQNQESELHILPYCLGDACQSVSFNINYNQYTSSLREPNPDYYSYYSSLGMYDEVWSEATTAMEKRRIEMVTVDHISQSPTAPTPPPDFLSIDTQGSEYEILQGAKETLKSSVLALVIEAEFHPLYKDQKLFGDLTKLLSDQGFDFVKFFEIVKLSPFRAPIGLRGECFDMFSDALFLRRINRIDDNGDEVRHYFMLRKLAFIAIVFNQFEYGLECLRRSKDLSSHHSTMQEAEPVYLRFLRHLEQRLERMPKAYPPTTRTEMVNKAGRTHRIKQILKRIPFVPTLYFLLIRVKRVLNKLVSKVGVSARFTFTGYTGVETVLIKYGLKTQANILRKNRIIQSGF